MILSGLCAAIDQLAPAYPSPAAMAAAVLWSAALIIFAFGIRGSGSVTARRRAGTAVFVVFAAWSIVSGIQQAFFPFFGGLAFSAVTILDYVSEGITLILALLAALVVMRSGAVTPRWNWTPLWVLVVLVVVPLVPFALSTIAPHPFAVYSVVRLIEAAVTFFATAFLGVVAIAISNRGSLTPPRLT